MTFIFYEHLPDALQEAIRSNDLDAIKLSLSELLDDPQAALNACLDIAMLEASLQTVEMLLQHGAKLSEISHRDAFKRGDPAVFQLLINSGWDINSTDFELSAVQLLIWLLEHGANPNKMSRRLPGSCLMRSTPLASAAKLSDPTPTKILLSHGAEMDPEAISFAIGFGRQYNGTATLRVLIDHGADINYVSERWRTPLFHAVWRNQGKDLKVLLDNGADPTIQGPNGGASALEIAKSRGRMDFYKMMETADDRETS